MAAVRVGPGSARVWLVVYLPAEIGLRAVAESALVALLEIAPVARLCGTAFSPA